MVVNVETGTKLAAHCVHPYHVLFWNTFGLREIRQLLHFGLGIINHQYFVATVKSEVTEI